MLIVLTGKTASGKDTVKEALLAKYPNLKRIVTSTSRASREGEKDGIDYYFLSKKEFEEKVKNNEFLEYVEYGGNSYGTERKEFAPGTDTLWKIDPSRAGKIRQLIKRNLVVIYINTADDVILKRLKQRGLSDEEIEKRMADDKKIWDQYKGGYDYIIENVPGKLNETIDKITTILATQGEALRG